MYSSCFAQLTASVISASANERIAKEATRAAVTVIKKHGSDAAKQELTVDLKAARDNQDQILEAARSEYKKLPQVSCVLMLLLIARARVCVYLCVFHIM